MTTDTTPASRIDLVTVAELAAQLRVDSIRSSTSAGSGHPTSSMSAADLLAVLVARHLRYDWDSPRSPANDHLIFSKGHASPLLYSVFKAVGVISEDELMSGYRRFGQRLQGHPTAVLPWVDVATGSLGQGLPDGVGIALAARYLEHRSYRVWVLCGDSEMAEGSMWEALDKAAYYRLSNLIAIVDVNRLGQRGATELGWDLDAYRRRGEAFGARVLTVDGHDLAAIDDVLTEAENTPEGQPTVVVARTVKGRGFSEVEDSPDWHGKPFPPNEQQMVAAATGLAARGYKPFASTFAAFLTRAYDFIRMGAISDVDLRLVGSHAGVEIGADGPSQMALEDLAMMRAVHGSTVLYPADATCTAALVEELATVSGISYLRTTRGAYPVLYPSGEAFPVGGAKVIRSSDADDVTLVGAGVTLHACLHGADILAADGVNARVIDCYSIKPIDAVTLTAAAVATAGRVVVAEDHHPEGGLGSAVTDALVGAGRSDLRLAHLAVRGMPGSGSGEELLTWAGIDAGSIATAARRLMGAP
jgi:transketolase